MHKMNFMEAAVDAKERMCSFTRDYNFRTIYLIYYILLI